MANAVYHALSYSLAGSFALGMPLAPCRAQTLTTLYTFTGGADGSDPLSGLLAGPHGSFYGTTSGGTGTIFAISPPAQGQTAWTLTTLYTFTGGADGAFPEHLVADHSGALYGMTNSGGIFNGNCAVDGIDYGCGTVFRLLPPSRGQTEWTLQTLYAFTGGADSGGPTGGVVFDGSGNLFGFTAGIYQCGMGQCGSAYELSPPAPRQTAWTLTTLHSFTGGADGGYIGYFGLPVLDPSGEIFGIAGTGGDLHGPNCKPLGGCGLVFGLTPPAHGGTTWHDETLLTFTGHNGITPTEGLSEDSTRTLYGTAIDGGLLGVCTPGGGDPNGCGIAYSLTPPGAKGSAWTAAILHRFTNGKDGGYPLAPPFLTGPEVYVTTSGDEVVSFGSIDAFNPPGPDGHIRHVRTLFSFKNDADGSDPTGTLIERNGMIYGTTYGSGTGPAGNGTVYMFKP